MHYDSGDDWEDRLRQEEATEAGFEDEGWTWDRWVFVGWFTTYSCTESVEGSACLPYVRLRLCERQHIHDCCKLAVFYMCDYAA